MAVSSSTPVSMSAEEIRAVATWPLVIDALREGHRGPPAQIGDTLVGDGDNRMLVRSAWVPGVAAGVKAATVVPSNPNADPPRPAVHAQMMLFDTATGELTALVDGTELTAWKTAGDSAFGCDLLARSDAKTLLMIGAGAMAAPLIEAHLSVRPSIERILIWNRTEARAQALVERFAAKSVDATFADDFGAAAGEADIICCATMSSDPILQGAWLKPGAHVDLVGAFTPQMREADDEVHRRGRWFVDSRDTTIGHIGELTIPIADGLIGPDAVKGDLHDLVAGRAGRVSEDEITVFKNGGGAHLDIMTAAALVEAHRKAGRA